MPHIRPPTTPKRSKTASVDLLVQSPYFSPRRDCSKDLETVALNSLNEGDLGRPLEGLHFDRVEGGRVANASPPRCGQVGGQVHNSSYVSDSIELEKLKGLKPNLIQEQVAHDPWKLLVAVTLLNKTAGKLAIPVFYDILERWPTPYQLSQAEELELVEVIRRLGTQNIRTKRLIAISKAYLQGPPSLYDIRASKKITIPRRSSSRFFTPTMAAVGQTRYPGTPISHYPGTGPYALDSYRIFATVSDDPGSDEWKTVMPTDKELILFLKWKWAFVEGKEWSPTKGVVREMTQRYMSSLITQLEKNTVTSSLIHPPILTRKINNKQNFIP